MKVPIIPPIMIPNNKVKMWLTLVKISIGSPIRSSALVTQVYVDTFKFCNPKHTHLPKLL